MVLDLAIWLFLFVMGYLLVYFFADYVIDILEDFSEVYNISPMLVGLFILGIDLEESTVSLIAALNDLPYISLGNLIGNTIIAVAISFGLPVLLYRFEISQIPSFYYGVLLVSGLSITVSMIFPQFLLLFALVNILLFGTYTLYSIKIHREYQIYEITNETIENDNNEDEEDEENHFLILKIIIALGIIFLGAEMLIFSAEQLIEYTGLTETFFGLVIMAFVTNVEEFWLIANAIKKGQITLGISAEIGKILWNITLIYGICGLLLVSIKSQTIMLLSSLVFIGLIGLLVFNLMKANLSKRTGIIYMVILAVFIVLNGFYAL
ncbi:MAG: sodium:calcium antiporter [Promethearchaeota archaeon]